MIAVHQSIDPKTQTVTWKVEETPPEHDIGGVMCHAVDEAAGTKHVRHILNMLGYRMVSARVSATDHLTLYWVRP